MIQRTAQSWQRIDAKNTTESESWQQQLQQAITSPKELLNLLELDPQLLSAAELAAKQFPLKVPRPFIERIEKGNLEDPLLKQILPIGQELSIRSDYSNDPVGEQQPSSTGIIQKYHGRVLLMVNGHCAINCRYCFRRHFPYEEHRLNRQQWEQALSTLAEDQSISEVIFSGGDPLASSDRQLIWLTEQITQIPHIKRLRVHTRLPVVIPERITEQSLQWLCDHHLKTVMVLHINHPNELKDDLLQERIHMLKANSVTLLNQAVLLKGINDTVETQVELSEALFDAGILPYYLHLLDKVQGAAHFDIHLQQSMQLYKQIEALLPGYLLPKLVKEVAGEASKTLAQKI